MADNKRYAPTDLPTALMRLVQNTLANAAAKVHTHSASDITSGTLPIARGGTGGTDAVTACENLGVYTKDYWNKRLPIEQTGYIGSPVSTEYGLLSPSRTMMLEIAKPSGTYANYNLIGQYIYTYGGPNQYDFTGLLYQSYTSETREVLYANSTYKMQLSPGTYTVLVQTVEPGSNANDKIVLLSDSDAVILEKTNATDSVMSQIGSKYYQFTIEEDTNVGIFLSMIDDAKVYIQVSSGTDERAYQQSGYITLVGHISGTALSSGYVTSLRISEPSQPFSGDSRIYVMNDGSAFYDDGQGNTEELTTWHNFATVFNHWPGYHYKPFSGDMAQNLAFVFYGWDTQVNAYSGLTGTVPISHGGTGASSTQGARTALDVYSKSELYTRDQIDAIVDDKAGKGGKTAISLASSSWVQNQTSGLYEYDLESVYDSSLYDMNVDLDWDDATSTEIEAWEKAKIVGSYDSNKLVCRDTVPTISMPIVIFANRVGDIDWSTATLSLDLLANESEKIAARPNKYRGLLNRTVSVPFNGSNIDFEIVDLAKYDLLDGSRKAGCVLMSTTLPITQSMCEGSTNAGGWEVSNMRSRLLNIAHSSQILQVKIPYYTDSTYQTVAYSSGDYWFIASRAEYTGSGSDGSMFAGATDSSAWRDKDNIYWTRTPKQGATNVYWSVDGNGGLNQWQAMTGWYYCRPCCCI